MQLFDCFLLSVYFLGNICGKFGLSGVFFNVVLWLSFSFFFFNITLEVHSHLVVFLSFQEIEQSMNMLSPNPELPDVSELVTKFFSGSKGSSKAGGSSKGTRPAVKRR